MHCKPKTSFFYTEESGFEDTVGFTDLNMSTAGQLDANGDGIPDFLATRVTVDGVDASPTLAAAQITTDIAIGIASSYLSPAGYVAVNAIWDVIKGPFWGTFGADPKVEVIRKMRFGTGDRANVSYFVDNVSGIPCDATKSPAFFLDYDQDGKDDIVSACGTYNEQLYVARSLASPGSACVNCGTFASFPSSGPALTASIGHVAPGTVRPGSTPPFKEPYPIVLDVNGDSLQDVITCRDQYTLDLWLRKLPEAGAEKQPFSQGFASPAVSLFTDVPAPPSNPHTAPPPRALLDLCGQASPTYNTFDVDGDGTPDLLVRGQTGWVVLRYVKAEGASATLSWQPVTFSDVGGKNGSAGGNIALGDFNGDGLADVWHTDNDKVIIWLNTGGNLFTAKYLNRPRPALMADSRYGYRHSGVLDYNADGLSDLLENWQFKENVDGELFINDYNAALMPDSGVNFFTAKNVQEIRAKNLSGTYFTQPIDQTGDVDGDGNLDVFNDNGAVFFGRGSRNTLLKNVIDGLGNTVTVEYDSKAYQADASCAGSSWPEKCLPHLNGIVSSHTEAGRTYKYTYKNAHVNVTGHGWLGFDQRTVNMTSGDVSTSTTVDYEANARYGLDGQPAASTSVHYIYPFVGLPKQIRVTQLEPDGAAVPPLQSGLFDRETVTTNTWSVKMSASNRPFPVVTSRDVSTYDVPREVLLPGGGLGGDHAFPPSSQPSHLLKQCTDSFDEDLYGNVKFDDTECQVRDATGLEYSITHSDFAVDEQNWLISNPGLITVDTGSLFPVPASHRSFHFTYLNGLLSTVERQGTAAQQHKTTYYRNDFGNVWYKTEEAPSEATRNTVVTYDDDDIFPSTVTDAEGQTTQIAFDPKWGAVTGIVDGNGVAHQASYDGFGRKTKTSGPSGVSKSSYEFISQPIPTTAAGAINPKIQVAVQVESASGAVQGGSSLVEYDNLGRAVRSTTKGFGGREVVQEQVFNALGQLLGATQSHTADLELTDIPYDHYSYDHLQRPTQVDHMLFLSVKSSRKYQYASSVSLDPNLHPYWLYNMTCPGARPLAQCAVEYQLTEDEVGHQDVVVNDYRGRVVRNIDGENIYGAGHSSNYIFSADGPLAQARDNAGLLTELDYDDYGRMTTRTDPDTGSRGFTFDGFDELKTSNDPKQQLRSYSYDVMGRTTSIVDPAGTTRWVYESGRLTDTFSPGTSANIDGQHVHYAYELATPSLNRGFLESATYTLDGTDYSTHFKYDELGRSDRVEYPDLGTGAKIVTKSHYDDVSGLLDGLDEVGAAGSTSALWKVTDNVQGYLIAQETFGNGATTATSTYGYHPERRWLENIQTTLGDEQVQSIEYSHYDNGLVHTVNSPGLARREYVYDPLDRLRFVNETPAQGDPVSTAYSYDAIGNLVGRGATVTVPVSAQPHLIGSVGDNFYGYDANGNVSSRFGPDIPRHSQNIDYTPFDLPKSVLSGVNDPTGADPVSVAFEYSADEERVVRRDSDSTRYFAGELYQRKVDSSGNTLEERFRLFAGGRQIGEVARKDGTDKTLFFYNDHLGSPETIGDNDGATSHVRFDPFGLPTEAPNPELTRVGFTGQDQDTDLGLVDMKGRIYDPLAGRFMSPDPLTQAPFWSQGLNRYSYVFNNPVNNTDPSGFSTCDECGWGMMAWSGGVTGLAALQGFGIGAGGGAAAAAGGGGAVGPIGGGIGALVNVGISLGMGGLGGRTNGYSYDLTAPSAASTSNGVSHEAPAAQKQNKGGIQGLARPPSACDVGMCLAQSTPAGEGAPGYSIRTDGTGGGVPVTQTSELLDAMTSFLSQEISGAINIIISLEEHRQTFLRDAPYRASANQMNKEVKRGQAPREVKRVDNAHPPEDPQDHAHLENGTRVRRDGTTNPESASIPKSVVKWLRGHGWNF